MRTIRAIVIVALASAALAWPGSLAEAHAVLVETSPKAGETVTGPDIVVRLRYNARIDRERSSLVLIALEGRDSQTAVKLQAAPPDVLTGKVTGLAPGKYRLRWQVLAVDGHITRGDVEFSVRTP